MEIKQILRKKNRLSGYDYSQNGTYFVTICTENRIPWLARIDDADDTATKTEAQLTRIGTVVEQAIHEIRARYEAVAVDHYVIMPNHVHLLICIDTAGLSKAPSLSVIVNQFKGTVTKNLGESIWQKGFYDHIIRDEADYLSRWKYIESNPAKWMEDELYRKELTNRNAGGK